MIIIIIINNIICFRLMYDRHPRRMYFTMFKYDFICIIMLQIFNHSQTCFRDLTRASNPSRHQKKSVTIRTNISRYCQRLCFHQLSSQLFFSTCEGHFCGHAVNGEDVSGSIITRLDVELLRGRVSVNQRRDTVMRFNAQCSQTLTRDHHNINSMITSAVRNYDQLI